MKTIPFLLLVVLIGCCKETDPKEGTFTDSRDNHVYRWVTIGTQTWMAENLAYLPAVSPPADGAYNEPYYYVQGYEGYSVTEAVAQENYSNYGVLYNAQSVQGACPAGWHFPSDGEWQDLETFLGMDDTEIDETGNRLSGDVGKKLKSTSGWSENGNGNNSSGFNALPGGSRNANGQFGAPGTRAGFRTPNAGGSTFNFSRNLSFDSDGIDRGSTNHTVGLSVRCIKDIVQLP